MYFNLSAHRSVDLTRLKRATWAKMTISAGVADGVVTRFAKWGKASSSCQSFDVLADRVPVRMMVLWSLTLHV